MEILKTSNRKLFPELMRTGRVFRRQGEFGAAVDSFQQAIGRRPTDIGPRLLLADSLLESGRPLEAVKSLREALSLLPHSALLEKKLGEAAAVGRGRYLECLEKFKAGDLDSEKKIFEEVILLDPNFGLAVNRLARVHLKRGAVEKAIELYNEFLARHPENIDINYRLFRVFIEQKKYPKCLDVCRKIMRLAREKIKIGENLSDSDKENYAFVLSYLARTAFMRKDYQKAKNYLEEAIGYKSDIKGADSLMCDIRALLENKQIRR